MQHLRSERGVTLIEIAIVIAIVAILTALTAPSLNRYFRRQDARQHTQRIASALQNARSKAVKEGNNYFVLFDAGGVLGQLRIVDDDNNDWQEGGGEDAVVVQWDPGSDPAVTTYGAVAGPPPANTVPEDGGGAVPGTGTTLPIDPVTALPAVGFNPRGIPVALASPGDWSSGSGSYYITDNDQMVYAVTLLPLGGVRVRGYQQGTGQWI